MKVFALLFLSTSSFLLGKVTSKWPASIMLPYDKIMPPTKINEAWLKINMPILADQSEQSLTIYFCKQIDLNDTRLKVNVKYLVAEHKFKVDRFLYAGSSQEPKHTTSKTVNADPKSKGMFGILNIGVRRASVKLRLWTRTSAVGGKTWLQHGIDNRPGDASFDGMRFVRVEGANVDLYYVNPIVPHDTMRQIPVKMVPGMRIFLSGRLEVEKKFSSLTVVNLEQGGHGKNLMNAYYHDRKKDEYDQIAQLWQWQQDATLQMLNEPNGTFYGALDSYEETTFTWALEFYDAPGRGLIKVYMFDTLVGEVNEFDGYTFINGTANLMTYFLHSFEAAFWVKMGDEMVQVDPLTTERLIPARN